MPRRAGSARNLGCPAMTLLEQRGALTFAALPRLPLPHTGYETAFAGCSERGMLFTSAECRTLAEGSGQKPVATQRHRNRLMTAAQGRLFLATQTGAARKVPSTQARDD